MHSLRVDFDAINIKVLPRVQYFHNNLCAASTARIGRGTVPRSDHGAASNGIANAGATRRRELPRPLTPSLPSPSSPSPGRSEGRPAGPLGCVCQVAMIECSSAIIAHINHHPLKRVNNILPSSLALATRSWRWGRARAGQARPGQAAGGSRRRYTKRVDCMTAREGMDDGRKTVMDICFETGKRHFTHGNGIVAAQQKGWINCNREELQPTIGVRACNTPSNRSQV